MVSQQLKFKVLGKPWSLRAYFTNKAYKDKNGKDSVAVTRTHKRRVDLSPRGSDLETIVHELAHVYIYEMCLGSATLSVDSLEEVFCELIAKRGEELLQLASKIHKEVARAKRKSA